MTGEGPGTHSEMNIVSESELEAPDLQRSSSAHYKEKMNILRKRVKKRENRFKSYKSFSETVRKKTMSRCSCKT